MKKHEAFPSKYIKTEDLNGKEHTLTIAHVIHEMIKDKEGHEEKKSVLYFEKSNRGWILNGINWDSIEAMHGIDSDDWTGKKVTLYPSKTQFGNKVVPCIRVRPNGSIPQALPSENPAFGQEMDDEITF